MRRDAGACGVERGAARARQRRAPRRAPQFCHNGACENCAPPAAGDVVCATGELSIDFKFTNPALPIRFCVGTNNELLVKLASAQPQCALAWQVGRFAPAPAPTAARRRAE